MSDQGVKQKAFEESYGSLSALHIANTYYPLKRRVVGSEKDKVFWQNDTFVSGTFFVRYVRLSSDETRMTLKTQELNKIYPVHVELLIFSLRRRIWLINK